MTPRPTQRCVSLAAAGACAFVVSGFLGSSGAVAASAALLVGIACAYAATLPESRRLRAESIELAWWVEPDAHARRDRVVAKRPFTLRFFLRHAGVRPVVVTRVELVSETVEADDPLGGARLHIPASSRVDHEVRCVCHAPGRSVLHGARVDVLGPLGLFETSLYFPNRLRLATIPERPRATLPKSAQDDDRAAARRTVRHRRDEGMDLHELRPLRPGDPFRRIAWKASARLGTLVVREPEREELGSLDVILDVSGSMREGVAGDRRIDHAASIALALVDDSLARGERVGFFAVDRRVVSSVPSDTRSDQRAKITDAMLAALACVDEDRTVEDDGEVARRVARYVRFQEGLDFLDARVRDGVHVERLALHLASRARGHHEVQASSPAGRILRRYADLSGIPLTPRTDRNVDARTSALGAALSAVGGPRRAPSRVVLVTDGRDVDFEVRLRAQLARLRRHGHGLEVFLVGASVPGAREFGLRDDSPIALAYGEEDASRRRAIATRLRGRGFLVRLFPDVPPRAAVA